MKAAVYRAYGPPDVVRIEEVAKPTPGADEVVVEEPLEIRVGEKPVSVTLRTPGEEPHCGRHA